MIYSILNRKTISDLIIPDSICKGYSVHSPKAIMLWEALLNCLLECFNEELEDIKIINNVPQLVKPKVLTDFYEDSFYRIEDRIPGFIGDDGSELYITTDELPYLFSNLDKGTMLFSTYTVVRPRAFAVKPYLREEFIRYFQFVISSDINSLDNIIEKIKNAITRFFERIRISVVLVDRHSDSYYLKKSCFHSVWLNGNVESVLQCGILKKRFDNMSGKEKIVIDIGGAQRLLASFIYANSDSYGLFLPYHMRNYDVIISGTEKSKILGDFIEEASSVDCRIKFLNDVYTLKKVKNDAIEESSLAIVVQRRIGEKEFLTIYNRDMTKLDLYSDEDIKKWFTQKYKTLEMKICDTQTSLIYSKLKSDKLYFKNGKKSYAIIKEGLFN